MKHYSIRQFLTVIGPIILTLGMLLPISCSREVFTDIDDEELVEMTITVGSNTRTVNDGNGTIWTDGDDLTVIHSATSATAPSFWPSQFFFYGGNAFHGTVSRLSATNNWYAVYPYAESNASANDIAFSVPYNQTQTGNASRAHLAGRNFPLFGKAEGVERSSELNLPMKNLLAVAKFNVTNNSGAAITIKDIEYTASSPIAGTFSVDLTGETPVFNNGSVKTVKLHISEGTTIAADDKTEFYMAIAPYEAAAGTVRQVKVVATDGTTCYRTYSTAVTFKSGVMKNIDFAFDKNHQTPEMDNPGTAGEVELEIGEEPEDGVYLLVYDNGENSMAFAAFDEFKSAKYAIPVSVVDGLVYPKGDLGGRDLSDFAVELENTGVKHQNNNAGDHLAYNVKNAEGKYVFYATAQDTYSGVDALHILESNEMTIDKTTYQYFHTFSGDADGVRISCAINTGNGNFYLLSYTAEDGFNYQKNNAAGTNLHLYKLGETTPKVEQTIEFTQTAVTYNFDNVGDFLEPQLTGDYYTTVTYSSNNTSVATVDENGSVTIHAAGTATITATAPAGTVDGIQYKSASASYTITSTSTKNRVFYLTTELEANQEYLIVSSGKALTNNNGSIAATTVSPVNGEISIAESSSMVWASAQSGGGFSFANAGKYITTTSSSYNQSLSLGNTATEWNYDGSSNYLSYSQSFGGGMSFDYYLYYSSSSWTLGSSYSGTPGTVALYSATRPATKQTLNFENSTVRWVLGEDGNIGSTFAVQSVTGNKTSVTYTSSNTDVATISGTMITVIGKGSTTITATAPAGTVDGIEYKAGSASYTLRIADQAPAGFMDLGSFNLENAALTAFLDDASVRYPADDQNTIANNTYASTSVISTYANWSSPSRKDIPAPVELSWDVASTGTATVTVYSDQALTDEVWTWTASTGSKSFDVYNLIPGLTYYCTVVDDNNGNYLLKGTFNTEGRRRMIKVSDTVDAGHANNCRDLGGLKTTDGRRIKYGLIFRGTNMTSTTTAEKKIIAEFMNVGLDNDLRSGSGGGSNRDNPFEKTSYSVRYVGPGYSGTSDLQNVSKYKQTIQAFLDAAKPGTENYNKASYFHCYIGADRTGYTGLIIEGLLGVSLTDCTIDYELTTFSTAAGSRPRNGGQLCYIKDAVTFLNQTANGGTGTSLQEKITYYLINKLSISETDIENFKAWALEPDPDAN